MIEARLVLFLCLAVFASAFPSDAEEVASTSETDRIGNGNEEDICKLPPTTLGKISCYGFYQMWTYNSTAGRCESYVYGGCGRTANLFRTEERCQSTCDPQSKNSSVEAKPKLCLLPISAGSCTGFNVRYAFNREKNACESFIFGGCDGTDNNFLTLNECYETCGGNVPKSAGICEAVVCPTSHKYYMNKGCLPRYKPNSCCPYKFDCPDEEMSTLSCHYRGLAFKIGQPVIQMMEDDPCNIDCVCRSNPRTNQTRIKCKRITCPPLLKQSGIPIMKPGYCCPISLKRLSDSPQKTPLEETCHVNGSHYLGGQIIPTLNPCRSCICVDGFTDENGPGCRDIHCTLNPPRHDCVPVFDTNFCCPIKYECEVKNTTTIIRLEKDADEQQFTSVKTRSDPCLQPKVEGPCEAYIPSYFYNKDSEDCEPFIYGGCHGNDNNFKNLNECRSQCVASVKSDPPTPPPAEPFNIPDVCKLPPKVGPCRGYKPRFYFNKTTGECQRFNYGGCRGNANNFKTIDNCQHKCIEEPMTPPTTEAPLQSSDDTIVTIIPQQELLTDPQCIFGNLTLNLGDSLQLEDPSISCVCSTPPEVTCTFQKCPVLENSPEMTCSEEYVLGQHCPTYSCIRNPPPMQTVDLCKENPCDEKTEICKAQSQESNDGNWLPPIARCVPASSIDFPEDDDSIAL